MCTAVVSSSDGSKSLSTSGLPDIKLNSQWLDHLDAKVDSDCWYIAVCQIKYSSW